MATYTNIPPASGGGGTVTTDGVTIQGDGSGGSPIAQKPSAALTPDSQGYFYALFQQKTGLSPLAFWSYYNDFANHWAATTGANGQGGQAAGTGSGVSYNTTSGNGVLSLKSTTAGAGYGEWTLAGASNIINIVNVRTKRWLVAYRVACASAPAAASRVCAGIFVGGTTMVGLGYGSAAANWKYCRGVPVAEIADTGKVIDTSGNSYLWMYIYNDLTNIRYCIDVVGGATETVGEVSTNVASSTGVPYFWNEGAASADTLNLDAVAGCIER